MNSVIEGRNSGGTYEEFLIDYSRAIVNMRDLHNLIHQGKLYYVIVRTRASSATRVVRIKTGANSLHVRLSLQSGLATVAGILRAPTIVTPGVAVDHFNYNHLFSDNGLTTEFFTGATYTGGQELRPTQSGFGSTPGQARTGSAAAEDEYVFRPNTEYILYQTPDASTDTLLIADFYEVPV